ncbi:MAG: PHP domain-containing protein [Anaerolineales bacterium]|uniref:PHP domain-containing protein n=1 Tax=Candidatus Desulfolinea nitratireducens TaxID=2841698 RepID=A0A8J6NK82_9CHLR|nr:PHP domain-containing protein [Candidatus Desulfolinea nitratireducens]MBL6960823.1 PHP domain-containing protein [Anaerolineales bacterium]
MNEIITNLHMHTRYTDGTGSHEDIAKAALEANLDVVITTDHNVLVQGPEGYYKAGKKRVLMIVGEEIHDQDRDPQKNHLLVFGTNQELAQNADDPQTLINSVNKIEGLSFIAHPHDPEQPAISETAITWEDWQVHGYTGIEIWNGLSEFKGLINTKLHALFYAYFPKFLACGPYPKTIQKWDELLNSGNKIVGVGGSDAHALRGSLGPLTRTLFPYGFHFNSINTHLLLSEALSGEETKDRNLILDAFRAGHAFIGYDLPAPTRGFRFSAQGRRDSVIMGDEIPAKGGVTLQAHLPSFAEIRLIKDGEVIREWKKQSVCTHITTEPGVYRIEAYRRYLGRRRGWIFSNPIYLR